MADEGRSSTIVVDSRLEKIFSPFGPETPSSSSLHRLEKEPCYKKAMHEGKALVEKQKILSLLRGIQPQVNSRQENICESLSDHRVHLQKVFQQAIRHLCLIQQTSPTSEASLVATHKLLQTIFQHVQFSLTSIGDGVEDLITSLAQHMCIPMTNYVKSLKSELTGGSLIHLVALVEEMEGVMRDKELELEEARRKMRVEEEKKMEALGRLKDANEKEGPWQSLLGSFWRPNESQKIFLLHNRKKTKKFTGFRLWTFPIIVGGPFGVVSAAEFIGIMLFTAYVIWAVSLYTIQNLDLLSKYELPSRVKRVPRETINTLQSPICMQIPVHSQAMYNLGSMHE